MHTSRELTGGSASTFWIVAADEDYDEEGNGDRDVMSCTDAALSGLDRQTPCCTPVAQKQSLCRRQIPPPQFRGSCQCVGSLVSYNSLSVSSELYFRLSVVCVLCVLLPRLSQSQSKRRRISEYGNDLCPLRSPSDPIAETQTKPSPENRTLLRPCQLCMALFTSVGISRGPHPNATAHPAPWPRPPASHSNVIHSRASQATPRVGAPAAQRGAAAQERTTPPRRAS